MFGVAAVSDAAEVVELHAFGDLAVVKVLEDDAVDCFLEVSWASLPLAVAVLGGFSEPFPASGFAADAYESVESCEFGPVEPM